MRLGIWLFSLWAMGIVSGLAIGGLSVNGAQPKWVLSFLISLFFSAICAALAKSSGSRRS